MQVQQLFTIELRPGEIIVAAVPHRDFILVITDRGTVYKVTQTEEDRY